MGAMGALDVLIAHGMGDLTLAEIYRLDVGDFGSEVQAAIAELRMIAQER